MNINLADLKYYLIPGEDISPEYWNIYSEAYQMWKGVWLQTFRELDGVDRIHSDDFTRQSMIGAIFHKDKCVSMSVHHDADFNLPTTADDSYFKAWPESALQELTRDGKKVIICSHLTVSPDYRGPITENLPLKNLTMALSVRHLLRTDAAVMTGTMRNNRGAQRTAYATGATPIMPDAQLHGVDCDLVGWYKNEVLVNTNLNDHIWTESLWRSRVEIPKQSYINNLNPKKKVA